MIFPLRTSILLVSRGTEAILTVHDVRSCPETKDAAGQAPPTMLRIAATTSVGSIRTV